MTDYLRCHCPECQTLDKLPVARHGIPHAWQPNMLAAVADFPKAIDRIFSDLYAQSPLRSTAPQQHVSGLALFGGGEQPRLL